MKFKVGDKVRIVNSVHSLLEVGSEHIVDKVDRYNRINGFIFDDEDLEFATQLPQQKSEPIKLIVAPGGEGLKFDQGKPPISLIPAVAILGMAKVFAYGAKKYGKHNFRLGMDHSRPLDAAARHLLAIMNGEDTDPETGEPHWAHLLCSVAMYAHMKVAGVGTDDRYKPELKGQTK